MKQSKDSDIERILKCRATDKASCRKCDLSKECKKFRKFVKENSQYIPPRTHAAKMMDFHT